MHVVSSDGVLAIITVLFTMREVTPPQVLAPAGKGMTICLSIRKSLQKPNLYVFEYSNSILMMNLIYLLHLCDYQFLCSSSSGKRSVSNVR